VGDCVGDPVPSSSKMQWVKLLVISRVLVGDAVGDSFGDVDGDLAVDRVGEVVGD